MGKDELKKRSKGVAFVIALLVLATSLSQCHNEPDEELLETIDNSDNLGNEHHGINDGSLDADKNNEQEHTHDFVVEESTEETSVEEIAPEASSETSTSDNVNSNKKKDKGKEDSSNSASTLASLIENIIAPIIPSKEETGSKESGNDNSNSGSDSSHEDDNKGWHVHVWGPWKDNGANEIRTCLLNSSHTQTRNHSYGTYTYDPTTGKDSATCSQCGHVDVRDHLHHWGAWTDNGTNEIRRCNDDSSHTETRNHSYGAYVYDSTTGKDVATCSQCGHKISRDHEHHYGEWMDNGTNEKRVCSDDSSHIETRSHTMGAYAYNSSTGLEESHCSTCSHVDTRAHNHHYGSDAEEIVGEAGVCYKTYHVCSDCSNKEYTSTVTAHTMSGYTYNPSTGLEEATCSKCGYKETRNHDHTWTYGTENVDGDSSVCYRDYRHCDVCGTTEYTDNHDHSWGDYTDGGDQEICVCGNNSSHVMTRSHNFGDYVYDSSSHNEVSTCNTCGATRERSHNHVFGGGTTTVKKYEPDVCYEVIKTCDICGDSVVVESVGHNFEDVPFGGGTIERCTYCGETRDDLGAKIDIYNMLKDILNNIKNKDVFFDNSLLCDNKSRVLKKNNNERV